MELKTLSDENLITATKKLITEEKKIIQEVLDHLCEIEERRLYATLGYPSLFEFVVKELGYSESSADRRISAMRLMRQVPEAREKLAQGTVNLSTLTQLHGFIRKEQKIKNTKLQNHEKVALLKIIENKSQKECEREFVRINPEIVKFSERARHLSEDLVEIKFIGPTHLAEKLDQLKSQLFRDRVLTTAELIDELANLGLEKVKKKSIPAAGVKDQELASESILHSSGKNENSKKSQSRYIRVQTEKEVWQKYSGRCAYVSPMTGKKCGSTKLLEYDHIIPLAVGGRTTADNLRLLCRAHNKIEAIRTFGKEKMGQYLFF